MTTDPVLDRLLSRDQATHSRVCEALLMMGGSCALATASYDALPASLIAVAAGQEAPVRRVIASRADCPTELLERLAQDSDASVRRAVAGNESAPIGVLTRLAADGDRWVRFDAFHNTSATEEVRAAAALASSGDDLERRPLPAVEDPRTPPGELRRLAETALSSPNDYQTRARLAENPNLPEDVVPALVDAARDRWEWRSLWSRRTRSLGWPSTIAFTDPSTPLWVIEQLAAAGHPAAVLRTDLAPGSLLENSADGVIELARTELLSRALWRELALAGAVELEYWNNSVDGDQFFPRSPVCELLEPQSAAHFVLGGYSDTREWVETSDFLPVHNMVRLASELWEDWYGSGQFEEYTRDDLDLFAMAAAANCVDMGDLGISLTPAAEQMLVQMTEQGVLYPERDDYDTRVTVRDSALGDIGYSETSHSQKTDLVRLLQESRSDLLLARWGISSHFLACIALHPATPEDIRSQLADDPDPAVREAARFGAEGAQAGIVQTDAAAGEQSGALTSSEINTLVFRELIPQERFEEARVWLQQCIDREAGYESWNARSNLAVIEYMTGNAAEARLQFELVLASGSGPGFEAEEYLGYLDEGRIPELVERLEYSDAWREASPRLAPAGSGQLDQYLRFIRLLDEPENAPTFRDEWIANPGGFTSGFLDGVFEHVAVVESGLLRETAAKAMADYLEHVLLELPSPRECGGLGAIALAEGNRGRAEKLLRRAASAGDIQAARMLGTMLTSSGRVEPGQAWINVADSMT